MKFTLKKFIFFILLIIFLFTFNSNLYASTEEINIYAPSCVVINLNTGRTVYSKNANEKMYPASTTKVMTAILALENCSLNEKATVSHQAIFNVPSGYSNAALVEGEELSIYELLNVLLIPSANDAAFVLAEHIAGSVEKFSEMMNEKAKEIGCKNTHFVNPNGIHSDDHYTTAYDLALIGQYAMKNDTFRKIVSTTKYTLPITNKYDKTDRIFNTTNELIKPASKYYYEYATGCKTGYTEPAKNCIIATAKKDGMEFLCVILHDLKLEDGTLTRELDCKTLFDYCFDNYKIKKLAEKEDLVKSIKVKGATFKTKSLDLKLSEDVFVLSKKNNDLSNIDTNIKINEDLEAPIVKDSTVGIVEYTVDNYTYSVTLLATHDVYKMDYIKILLYVSFVIVIFLFIGFIKSIKKSRKKVRKYSHSSYYTKQKGKK